MIAEPSIHTLVHVLVVDDESSICTCVADFLRQQGFDVSEAHEGSQALFIAAEKGPTISAVLTDVNMPGMDGIEMWARMKPLVPNNCKILFMTGLVRKPAPDVPVFPGEVLQKPFSFNVLIDKLLH